MEEITCGEKIFLKFDGLSQTGIFHFTSTKVGWGSDGKSRFTGDDPVVYDPFRKELAQALHMNPQQFVFPRQVHGDRVEIVNESMGFTDIPDTDALITNQPGICTCVQTADCVPILLFDPVKRVIAAVHAGWRGTVNRIVGKTIQCMQQQFGSEPKNMLAAIGPSISSEYYEVGADVISLIQKSFPDSPELLRSAEDENKACLDLWEANRVIMKEAGLSQIRIETMERCSWFDESRFFSARRDGVTTGRMVTGIMLS